MAPDPDASVTPRTLPRSWIRVALLGSLSVCAALSLVILVYALARARVPEHRAALEHLVRSQTGLDIRFRELALRWGWYGPEAVFRGVELQAPDSAEGLLRAPELVVGFDAWRTLRSGHPEAGRIELVAPQIDFSNAGDRHAMRGDFAGTAAHGARTRSSLERVAVLERWRGGRIDINGGLLQLPDPGQRGKSLDIQIRRATLHRTEDDWNVTGLFFLPDRVGRSARVALHVSGDLAAPATLHGSLHVETRRLQMPAIHEIAAGMPALSMLIPAGGGGDVSVDVDFKHGRVLQVNGAVHAAAVLFDAPAAPRLLALDRVTGGWHAARTASGWRIRLHSPEPLTGTLAGVPVSAGIQTLALEWDPQRTPGDRLRASGRLERVALGSPAREFVLGGLSVGVSGTESRLLFDVESRTARLDWEQSQQPSLLDVRVSAPLRLIAEPGGWRLEADGIALEHQRAGIELSAMLSGGDHDPASAARIQASGSLEGVDIPLVMGLLGEDATRAFGAVASRLTSGRIHNGEFTLNGPLSGLPFGAGSSGFTGSFTLRAATVSGGDLWPDAAGLDARVEWRGARIQVRVDSGRAGQFKLASAEADWDATGAAPTRLTGQVNGRLETALAWVRDHPRLQEFTPDLRYIDAQGEASFDFNVSIPADGADQARMWRDPTLPSSQQTVRARVATSISGASVTVVNGLPPLEGLAGAFVFDAGRVQKTTLTGTWLGGPVQLRIGERRDRAGNTVIVQARGVLQSQQLATLAGSSGAVDGPAEWNGELSYLRADSARLPRWSMRIESNLLGVASSLAPPFAKNAAATIPARVAIDGSEDAAEIKADLGDRLRGLLALRKQANNTWTVERGAVNFGGEPARLPAEAAVLLHGRVAELDLSAYALAWQRLRKDTLPAIRGRISTGEMRVAGRAFPEVSLRVDHTTAGTDLLVDSAQLSGMARWTASPAASEMHVTHLDLPDGALADEAFSALAAFAPEGRIAIDELTWRGRSLGRVTASLLATEDLLTADDLRMVSGSQQAHGSLRCHRSRLRCRLTFQLDSADAAATLLDFGLAADVAAASASLNGELEWSPTPQQPWLATLRGTLAMRLADGTLRSSESSGNGAHRFALLAIPALVRGLEAPGSAGDPLPREWGDLHFASLQADFDLRDGVASTDNLHFDGDAEILMRGRTGLLSRDYDQQVWVLRGEERLPAAVRRFGATARVAAAWLSLRDLFGGGGEKDRSRAVLRLQGSWDDPMVVAEN